MEDRPEIMMRLYESHTAAKHHHENQCYSVTHCFLVVAGAALALAKFGSETPRAVNLLLGAFVIAIGIIGHWIVKTNYAVCRGCDRLADMYRQELEQKYLDICPIKEKSEEHELRALRIWPTVHGIIAAAGIFLFVATLLGERVEVLLAHLSF